MSAEDGKFTHYPEWRDAGAVSEAIRKKQREISTKQLVDVDAHREILDLMASHTFFDGKVYSPLHAPMSPEELSALTGNVLAKGRLSFNHTNGVVASLGWDPALRPHEGKVTVKGVIIDSTPGFIVIRARQALMLDLEALGASAHAVFKAGLAHATRNPGIHGIQIGQLSPQIRSAVVPTMR